MFAAHVRLKLLALRIGRCLQVFPTKVRSFGLGLNNSLSRLGAIMAPYLAVELARRGHADIAEVIIGGMCLVAAICASALPLETSGRALEVSNFGLFEVLGLTACLPELDKALVLQSLL